MTSIRQQTAIGALVVCVATGIACAQTPAPKLSDGKVKIGVLTDMSGLYSDIGGQGSIVAAQMAIDDFKARYKPAYPIELVYADHQNKADVGSTKAREWFDTQGVDMITDVLNSAVGLAVAKVAAEKHRVVINTGSGSSRLTNEDCTAYTVHYAYDTFALSNVAAKAIVKSGGDSWAFLTADYAFGHSLEKDATAVILANGGKVLGSVNHPLNTPDFSSYMLQVKQTNAKIVGLANAGGDTINAVRAANEFGVVPSQTLAALLIFISDVHSLGLKYTQGMLLTDGWYWDLNDETRTWSRRYFEKMKKMPSMLNAGIYSATLHYLEAIQASGTDDADTVMKAMKAAPINDVFAKGGQIRADGRMVHDMYLMQVKKPGDSKYPWDYYTVKAVVKGAEAFQPLSASRCSLVKN